MVKLLYSQELDNKLTVAKELAERNEISEIILGEFSFVSEKDLSNFPWIKDFTMVVGEEAAAEVYNQVFEKASKIVNGIDVAYGVPAMSIRGRKAEAVVKEWFRKL